MYQEDDGCWGDHGITQWWWGEDQAEVSVLSWATPSPSAPWRGENDFMVTFRVPTLSGIGLGTDTGESVGASSVGLFDDLPPAQVTQGYGDQLIGITEVGGTFDDDGQDGYWGLALDVREGSIAAIESPSGFLDFFC